MAVPNAAFEAWLLERFPKRLKPFVKAADLPADLAEKRRLYAQVYREQHRDRINQKRRERYARGRKAFAR